ncbi:hypothetical protein BZM27_26875 [Paraburkholderia steynii]|uniref:Uncharacterized protein n=1 Tax=Paraburkholderia steynii TaxID=1245441 RepID=A0A4R0XBG0_9BURK|nr:hypothetical protein BZM27_26875 [Paraburkholderia steynii]
MTHGTGFEVSLYGVTKMEKWLVVTGVWMMFATCMVLFIRGATGVSRRELMPIEVRDDERDPQPKSTRG